MIDDVSNSYQIDTRRSGGSSAFARRIVPVIAAAGGACLVRAPVSRVVLSDGGDAVLGVTVR